MPGAVRSTRRNFEDALVAHPDATAVAFVHAETSTGAQSDARTLAGWRTNTIAWPSSMP